jgi:hypothetical protein
MGKGFLSLAQEVQRTADRVDLLIPDTAQQRQAKWPDGHISVDGKPVKFHWGQALAYNSIRRRIAMIAGTQGGKTSFGPWWLWKEIRVNGGGDYLAVTSSYDLFKLKMLPTMLEVFEDILGIGRYWTGDRILELAHPTDGFLAKKSQDVMWGRVILRSAESAGGLESATAQAAWLDEAGQDNFRVLAWRAIKRRLALKQGKILFTTTLYNLGWLEREIMSPAEEKGVTKKYRVGAGELLLTDSEEADTVLIQFDSVVNPEYPMEEFEEARNSLPEDEFEMQYRGRVSSLRTLIYDCFDARRDVVEEFEIPGNWKRWLGMDFGGTNMAGIFFAEDPVSGVMYGYRLYSEGKLSVQEHVNKLNSLEDVEFIAFGGDTSEDHWRKEFGRAGLWINKPPGIGVDVGIQRVYAAKKKGLVKYFEDMWPIIDENQRYKRKTDENGNVTDEIQAKKSFHFLDAERYIISYVKASAASLAPGTKKYA